MNKAKALVILIALVLSSLHAHGQAIKTDFDRKVIYTDSLNLPRNTSASTLLALLPELLQRPGVYIISNYDVQIEGMSVGAASDVALSNLQIVDIEKVEVSESPVSSYQKNGQGGSINFTLRSQPTNAENSLSQGTWGSAGTVASSPLNIAPQFYVGYRKDKFMMRGMMLGEWHDINDESHTLNYYDDNFANQSFTVQNKKIRTQLARLYTSYNFSDKDVIMFNLSEIYSYNKSFQDTDYDAMNSVGQTQKAVNLQALAIYQHRSRRSTFTALAEYQYTPLNNWYEIPESYSYDNDRKANSISGKLEYRTTLLNGTTKGGASKKAEVVMGSNFNSNLGNETTEIFDANVSDIITKKIPQNNTYYIMPYLTLSGTFGKFRVKATGEFQHFRYYIERQAIPYSATSNDFTGKLMAEWHFTANRNLRFILDRKLQRPSAEQLHPERLFDPKQKIYVEGNPYLLPTMVHEVAVDYICSHTWQNYHNIILNFGASFNHINDIVTTFSPKQDIKPGTIGSIQKYLSYENSGSNRIASANVMALYTYKAFSLSFAGNMYHKMLDAQDSDKHYTYFNLSLHPYFNLKDGWNGGARIVYYSRINQTNGFTGSCTMASINVGKSWNRFFVFLTEDVSLNKNNRDVATTGNRLTERYYQLIQSHASIGVKYTF